MKSTLKEPNQRKKWHIYEVIGFGIVILSLLVLLIAPNQLSTLIDTIINEVKPIIIDTFLTSEVGVAIIISVIIGRMLERLGFTDGLIRIFVPVMSWFKINPAVIIPSVYNILGDINAAGKIAAPILVKARSTIAEQKIAVATMIQSPQSFATFVIGLIALAAFGINSFPLVILSIFAPLIIVPFILSRTIYRDTKKVELSELPRFTPNTRFLNTIFESAREGASLLLLTIIPAVAVVFTIIGTLNFLGVWAAIEAGLGSFLTMLSIEPSTGIVSVLAAPTLAVAQLIDLAGQIDPRLVVGSFVIANSGFPLSVIIGQVPMTWAESSNLNERQVLEAAIIGMIIRLLTALVLGYLLTPFLVG